MSVKITMRDCRDPRSYVCRDILKWFRRHGLDLHRFVREGMTADELRAAGDSLDKIAALEKTALTREGLPGGW